MALPTTTSQPYEWTFRRVVWATLVLAGVVFGFWLLYRFYQIVFLLIMAMMIGTVLRPAVTWLYERGAPRVAGVLVVYLLAFAFLAGFLLLLSPLLLEQGKTITLAIPGYYQSFHEWMIKSPNPFIERLSQPLPAAFPGIDLAPQSQEEVMLSAAQVLGYIGMAAHLIFTTIVILFLILYWTLDGPRMTQSFLLWVPTDQRESTRELISAMESRLGFYIVGQIILCISIGLLALVAYLLIGLPNALVLAVLAGVLEAVPMIGPVLGAIPAAMVAVAIGPDKLIWVIVASIIIQQLENTLLVPRVMHRAVGVNPFVTLLALFTFSSFFGVAGAFMAIPIAAIIQLLFNHFVFHPVTREPEKPDGRDTASRLRYEAQEFAQDLRKQARLKKRGSESTIKQIDHAMDEIETIVTDLDILLAQDESVVDTL